MIRIERTAAVLLAAGQSRRFGEQNKLMAVLRNKPLAAHAVESIAKLPLLCRFAVIAAPECHSGLADLLLADGFTLVENPSPEEGQDNSIRIGVGAAIERSPDAILMCLADMPNVTADHLRALANAATSDCAAVSSTGDCHSPPVLIPAAMAERIISNVREPVRSMLEPRTQVFASPAMLSDVDTASDLTRAASPGQ